MSRRCGPRCAGLLALLALAGAPAARSCPEASEWLYDRQAESPGGYHLVCIDGDAAGGEGYRLRVWVNGHSEAAAKEARWQPSEKAALKTLRRQIRDLASMPKLETAKYLAWALFDTAGGRVRQPSQARGLLLAFEGGRWVWPGVRAGYERRLSLPQPGAEPRQLTLRTLSLRPLAFTVEGVLEDRDLAEHAIERATPSLKKTPEQHTQGSKRRPGARTNRQTFVDSAGDEKLEFFRRTTALIYRIPERLQESLEVLEYTKGQKYDAHVDFFDPRGFANQPNMMQWLHNGANRMVTGLWYISDVEGGQTFFPGRSVTQSQDFDVCKGQLVQPRFGNLLFWYNLMPNATLDYHSWHGGCEVKDGVKYVINICAWNVRTPHTEPVSNEADEPEAAEHGGGREEL